MRFPCTIRRTDDRRWKIACVGSVVGPVEVTAATREEAREKMLGELRYRLELCPCSGEGYRRVEIELTDGSAPQQ